MGLMGAKWGKCVKNPTIFLVGTSSTLQKNPTFPQNTQPQDEPSLHRPTPSGFALTLLRTAPYESNVGGWCQGSRLLRLIPLFGAPKWHPLKNWEMGGAPGLGGRHSMMIHNNQPNDGVGGGGGMGEETRQGGTCEGGCLPFI